MTGDSNMGCLRQAKQGLGHKRVKAAESFLIVIPSTIVSEQAWSWPCGWRGGKLSLAEKFLPAFGGDDPSITELHH